MTTNKCVMIAAVVCLALMICVTAIATAATQQSQRIVISHQQRPTIISNQLGSSEETGDGDSCEPQGLNRPSLSDYYKEREAFIKQEFDSSYGSNIKLSNDEQLANTIIMQSKKAELGVGIQYPYLFNPSRHIFEVLDQIKQSKLFKILRKMPKGAILHAHDTALCSADYLVTLTYYPNLWQCAERTTNKIKQFLFSRQQPTSNANAMNCTWSVVQDERKQMGASKYDKYVRTFFTLLDKQINPKVQFRDINDVWNRFMEVFGVVTPFITYVPVWKAYYKQAMKEMYEDGVQYLEFRGTLPPLYDLDGNTYDEEAVLDVYVEALNEFKNDNPGFIGSKFIYAPVKFKENAAIKYNFDVIRRLHGKYPNYLAGFDLVGQEDTAPILVRYVKDILELPEDIEFFFHAGETNWFGGVDENMVDAVLLGSKRIGHGYGLTKHPKLMELVKAKDIAIEVNPISNQVLKLVDDLRNHPASTYLAYNLPVVISSDDPSFWEVTPLSHDFYMAFLGIASANSDLRTLKKFAINSIKYSSLNEEDKLEAYTKWQHKWSSFITNLIHENSDF